MTGFLFLALGLGIYSSWTGFRGIHNLPSARTLIVAAWGRAIATRRTAEPATPHKAGSAVPPSTDWNWPDAR